MSLNNKTTDPAEWGEAISSSLSFQWIDPGRIEAGEFIAPARLQFDAAKQFAALHLVLGDLEFATECLKAADETGIPDGNNLRSKALIFSGVVAYARSFKSGVRSIRLKPSALISSGAPFDIEIHQYLIDLRDKHVAHSVNEFDDCEAAAIVIGTPGVAGVKWRDGSAVGVRVKQAIGMSRTLVRRAIPHIEALRVFLETDIAKRRLEVYAEFQAQFAETGKWEMAPMLKLADRTKIADRRG